MSLYFPQNIDESRFDRPHLHALVIGVGEYPYLIGGGGPTSMTNFGLRQITTSNLSAIRIADWLATQHRNPNCPVGSIELLLSPEALLSDPAGLSVSIESSSMANIRAAFARWFKRCNSHVDNTAFFYFAGHGISTASQLLLSADFGSPTSLTLWNHSIDFNGMHVGMRRNAAGIQLFFIDSCRETPVDALIQHSPTGDPLCDNATIFDKVNASAVYYAAAAGQQAYGPADGITFFATALLEALNGAGAHNKGQGWVVDTYTLANAIGQIMDSLALCHNQPFTCNADPQGIAPINFPCMPFVRTSIGCRSKEANLESEILLARGTDLVHSKAGDPRPWTGRVQPGDWDIRLRFRSYPEIERTRETIMPPVFDWRAAV